MDKKVDKYVRRHVHPASAVSLTATHALITTSSSDINNISDSWCVR